MGCCRSRMGCCRSRSRVDAALSPVHGSPSNIGGLREAACSPSSPLKPAKTNGAATTEPIDVAFEEASHTLLSEKEHPSAELERLKDEHKVVLSRLKDADHLAAENARLHQECQQLTEASEQINKLAEADLASLQAQIQQLRSEHQEALEREKAIEASEDRAEAAKPPEDNPPEEAALEECPLPPPADLPPEVIDLGVAADQEVIDLGATADSFASDIAEQALAEAKHDMIKEAYDKLLAKHQEVVECLSAAAAAAESSAMEKATQAEIKRAGLEEDLENLREKHQSAADRLTSEDRLATDLSAEREALKEAFEQLDEKHQVSLDQLATVENEAAEGATRMLEEQISFKEELEKCSEEHAAVVASSDRYTERLVESENMAVAEQVASSKALVHLREQYSTEQTVLGEELETERTHHLAASERAVGNEECLVSLKEELVQLQDRHQVDTDRLGMASADGLAAHDRTLEAVAESAALQEDLERLQAHHGTATDALMEKAALQKELACCREHEQADEIKTREKLKALEAERKIQENIATKRAKKLLEKQQTDSDSVLLEQTETIQRLQAELASKQQDVDRLQVEVALLQAKQAGEGQEHAELVRRHTEQSLEAQNLRRQLTNQGEETEALREELMKLHAEEGYTPLAEGGWFDLASVVRLLRNKKAMRAVAEAELFAAKDSEIFRPCHDAEKEALLDRLDEGDHMWWEEERPKTSINFIDVAEDSASPAQRKENSTAVPSATCNAEPQAQEEVNDLDEPYEGPTVGMREKQKGVYVFVRFRPSLPHEKNCELAERSCEDGKTLAYRTKRYHYDAVLNPEAPQSDVYQLINLIPYKALDGYSAAVMNYGGTGSGKTYTMVGRTGDWGIAPSLAHSLLSLIEQRRERAEGRGETATYTVTVSMLEIYNECTIDLLQPNCKDVVVRVLKNNVTVEGLTSVPMTSVERVVETVQAGFMARHQASTCGNKESSRSHAVLIFDVKGSRVVHGAEMSSEAKIFLVDLAGCENLSKAQLSEDALAKLRKKPNPDRAILEAQETLEREMKRINKSLSTLRKVIEEAASKKGTPIAAMCRESKLTLVLRECFGGRNLAVLLCCCSPLEKHSAPSLNTLEFGDVFRRIENAPAAAEVTTPDWRLLAEGLRRALCRVDTLLGEGSAAGAVLQKVAGTVNAALAPLTSAVSASLSIVSQALLQTDMPFGFPLLRGAELARSVRDALVPVLGLPAECVAAAFLSVFGRESGNPSKLSVRVEVRRSPEALIGAPAPPAPAELEDAVAPACKAALLDMCGATVQLAGVDAFMIKEPNASIPAGTAYAAGVSARFVQ